MSSAAYEAGPHRLPTVKSRERRGSQRSLTVYRLVRIERNGEEGLARCRNISDTGMKLDLNMPLSLNERLRIEFAPAMVLPARVVWTNGEQCGVVFDKSVDSTQLLSNSPGEKQKLGSRRPRLNGNLPARVVVDGRSRETTISDISQQGMKVTHAGDFQPGLHVKVVLENGTERTGMVQWTKDNFAGLFLFDHFSVMELGNLKSLE